MKPLRDHRSCLKPLGGHRYRDASDDKKAWAEFRLCRPCRAGGRGNGRKAKSEVC
ncbi:MAG: hypothetical protein RLZZ57_3288 [Pseudomonadota bacterium]|jgi:hypothetical protein